MALHKKISAGIASAATISSAFSTIGYDRVLVQAPGTYTVYVQGSQDGTTYKRLYVYSGASANVGAYMADFNTSGGEGLAECNVAANMNYVRLQLGSAATADKTAYVHVINSK